eukprot:6026-Rhodomonas_salina.1
MSKSCWRIRRSDARMSSAVSAARVELLTVTSADEIMYPSPIVSTLYTPVCGARAHVSLRHHVTGWLRAV